MEEAGRSLPSALRGRASLLTLRGCISNILSHTLCSYLLRLSPKTRTEACVLGTRSPVEVIEVRLSTGSHYLQANGTPGPKGGRQNSVAVPVQASYCSSLGMQGLALLWILFYFILHILIYFIIQMIVTKQQTFMDRLIGH